MDFDANQVTVPEAMDRHKQFAAEIEGRQQEIAELEMGVRARQGEIETHKMHIAACEAAMEPLRRVTDNAPKASVPMPDDSPPIHRRY